MRTEHYKLKQGAILIVPKQNKDLYIYLKARQPEQLTLQLEKCIRPEAKGVNRE